MLIDPALSAALCLSLAFLLAASAAHKARDPRQFVSVLRNYRIAPEEFSPLIAVAVIMLEGALAIGLLVPAARDVAASGAALLFAAYGAAIAVNLRRGRTEIDCGCSFGRGGERLSAGLLWRNALLAAASLLAAAPVGGRAIGLVDIAAIALFVATASAFYRTFETLRTNASRFHATERAR